MPKAPGLELGKEYPPPNERELLEQIEAVIAEKLKRDFPPNVRPALRDAHPKAHGCVRAECIVNDNLPEDLRVGIFREPRTYPAWIRFSASNATIQKDQKKDAHGFSIKLMNVPGEKILESEKLETTHDFILANNRVYFIRNLEDYLLLTEAVAQSRLLGFFFGWNPFKWRLHELKCTYQATHHPVYNLLQTQYWSETPYKWGNTAAKYSVRPRLPATDTKPCSSSPNFLQQSMAQTLDAHEVVFDFMIQLQTDPVKMPVEDATVVWNESLSPFRKVAVIRIPPQVFVTPERLRFAENLSYTPWHALPEHIPLGGINRARRTVYDTVSRLRHQFNNQPRTEPTDDRADG